MSASSTVRCVCGWKATGRAPDVVAGARPLMVATTAEGRVEARRWDDLKRAFAEALTRPEPGLVRMFLLQQRSDPTLWRVLALWRDAAALEARLASGPLRGTAVLHAAGVKHARLIVETEGQRMPE